MTSSHPSGLGQAPHDLRLPPYESRTRRCTRRTVALGDASAPSAASNSDRNMALIEPLVSRHVPTSNAGNPSNGNAAVSTLPFSPRHEAFTKPFYGSSAPESASPRLVRVVSLAHPAVRARRRPRPELAEVGATGVPSTPPRSLTGFHPRKPAPTRDFLVCFLVRTFGLSKNQNIRFRLRCPDVTATRPVCGPASSACLSTTVLGARPRPTHSPILSNNQHIAAASRSFVAPSGSGLPAFVHIDGDAYSLPRRSRSRLPVRRSAAVCAVTRCRYTSVSSKIFAMALRLVLFFPNAG